MADSPGLPALSAQAERCETDSGLSTFFRDGQRGRNGPVSALRWGTLRTWRQRVRRRAALATAGDRKRRETLCAVCGRRWEICHRTVPAYGGGARSPGGGTAERQFAGVILYRPAAFSLRASDYGFPAWTGSRGTMGRG